MAEQYIKAEIVRTQRPLTENIGTIFGGFFWLAYITLIVWWFVATWFPELGFTYWQLVLPVYAFRVLTGRMPLGRLIK